MDDEHRAPLARTFWGGLTAGVLDLIDGMITGGLKGMSPIQQLQNCTVGSCNQTFVADSLKRRDDFCIR
jgi:hypothetical protein